MISFPMPEKITRQSVNSFLYWVEANLKTPVHDIFIVEGVFKLLTCFPLNINFNDILLSLGIFAKQM